MWSLLTEKSMDQEYIKAAVETHNVYSHHILETDDTNKSSYNHCAWDFKTLKRKLKYLRVQERQLENERKLLEVNDWL